MPYCVEAGLAAESDVAGSSESHDTPLADDSGLTNTDAVSFDNLNFQNCLRHAALDRTVVLPDLPWETPAWRSIFDDDHNMLSFVEPARSFSDPPMPVAPGSANDVVGELVERKKRSRPLNSAEPIYLKVIGHKQDIAWEEKREADLQKSFMKWISVLQCWPETWKVRKELDECETVQASCELVSHYFSGKAPATLVKRANSMIYIMEEGHKLGYLFPYTEREFYNLLKTLKAAGAKSSRLKSVLEAVTLSRFTFNIDELHELTCSRRCYGAIAAGPLEKASQADPLTVADLKLLHEVLEGSSDLWDRAMAGASLFCVYSRARWRDFIHGGRIEIDKLEGDCIAYIEIQVVIHKTMHASARRFRFLSLVAPGRGVHGGDWVRCWLDNLQALGIDVGNDKHGCLMPAPDVNGQPLQLAVDTEEAGAWLRLLLGEHLEKANSSRVVSSHSLKSTMLSYAAKRGLSRPDRLSLGHHSGPYKMTDVYARDAQARDLRLMDKLVSEIRSGYFCPDESRAGRFHDSKRLKTSDDVHDVPGHADEMDGSDEERETGFGSDTHSPKPNVPDEDAATEEGHVTTDSSSSSDSTNEREMVHRQFEPPKAPSGYSFVKHKKSKLLHYVAAGVFRTLACGRNKSDAYEQPGILRYDSAVCHGCQKAISKD